MKNTTLFFLHYGTNRELPPQHQACVLTPREWVDIFRCHRFSPPRLSCRGYSPATRQAFAPGCLRLFSLTSRKVLMCSSMAAPSARPTSRQTAKARIPRPPRSLRSWFAPMSCASSIAESRNWKRRFPAPPLRRKQATESKSVRSDGPQTAGFGIHRGPFFWKRWYKRWTVVVAEWLESKCGTAGRWQFTWTRRLVEL